MERVSVHEAKAHFSEILRRAQAGETIIITRHNEPIVQINPIATQAPASRLGAFEGEITFDDDVFAPMTEEELKDWYGE